MLRTTFAIVSVFALLLASCGETGSESTTNNDQQADASDPRADWPETIRVGLVPSEGGTDIVERFTPLIEFVEQELGTELEASSASEYLGIITAMKNKQLEFAYLGPKSYVEAARIANAEAIIKELNAEGVAGYHSIIVVAAGSPIDSLEAARGKSFAFVTPNSTSGFLVPSLGINQETGQRAKDYFSEVRYTGSHGSSVQAVVRGDVEVAATNDLDLNAMAQAGQVDQALLREIWRSELIPGAPIAARGDVPESLKDAFRDAILKFADTQAQTVEAMGRGGFITATDEDYEIVRLLEQQRSQLEAGDG